MPQLIIKRSDGGVSLGGIADSTDPAEAVRKWQASHPDETAVSWRISDVPVARPGAPNGGKSDRAFREAWTDDEPGDQIDVNMPKARVIHMDRIRTVRDAELERESGSRSRQPPEIEALFTGERQNKLQALRDVPQKCNLEACTTTGELRAVWPSELPPWEIA